MERTILSVITQDYNNIEYIIMDGGSTDGSIKIIKKYEKELTFWQSKKDKGQANAIDFGWKLGTGDIFCWINSDDELYPCALSKVVDIFSKKEDIGMVYGDWEYINKSGNLIKKMKARPVNFHNLLFGFQQNYIAQPSSFYAASLVKELGYLNENLSLAFDHDLFLKILKKSNCYYIPEILSRFRIHNETKTGSQSSKHWKETIHVKREYSNKIFVKVYLRYLLFIFFNSFPLPIQTIIRRMRKSETDYYKINFKNNK